ncbi:MAG TPA: hypothetical protein DIU35_19575, partial [Candidatus Latescibacteria bacterium]|nr:hypothetical protein [Candidatus Latescibacterota bacterium]
MVNSTTPSAHPTPLTFLPGSPSSVSENPTPMTSLTCTPSDLSQKRIALCFTQGVSLRSWSETGLFDREVDLYNRLCAHIKGVNFLTYGDRTDLAYTAQLNDGIQIYPNRNKILRKA